MAYSLVWATQSTLFLVIVGFAFFLVGVRSFYGGGALLTLTSAAPFGLPYGSEAAIENGIEAHEYIPTWGMYKEEHSPEAENKKSFLIVQFNTVEVVNLAQLQGAIDDGRGEALIPFAKKRA